MFDDWEDWENEDLIIQCLTLNKERLKKLEEKKLIEESDNKLTNDLFCEEECLNEDVNYYKKLDFSIKNTIKNIENREKNKNNYNLNQEKQKKLSKIIKQKKELKNREKELFGEAEYDDYDKYIEYEKKFY
jgi:hypothetical protein